jgi:hypothetical protein
MKRTGDQPRALEDVGRGEAHAPPAPAAPTAEVLALQRSAGNRAVTALLSRAPDTAAPKGKEKPPAAASGHRVEFPGIGTIPVSSAQMGETRERPRPPSGEREPRTPTFTDMTFASQVGAHSAALFRASADGRAADVEVIMASGDTTIVIKLTNAIVSSYRTSGGSGSTIESWTLNFSAAEFRREGGQDETE